MKRTITAAFIALALSAGSAWADPSGSYNVEGANPGGEGAYKGTAVVSKNGDTFQVVWKIGEQTYTGTAIGNDDFLAVGYDAGGGSPGIAAFARKGSGWEGVWTYFGKDKIGVEKWSAE
ncbi:hypothetical protein [Labrys wisconsinensis]|uniref:Uncharacterized protein n=1 Tax=Labrys wisconsinensis TaxID=425677 RepID=A0ABU0J3U1_9HYPH|nr:hypothetical protein [Labrys wisconsinensis]MDQ0468904.1 hypothetical protein [Labrys wisconsinensis]